MAGTPNAMSHLIWKRNAGVLDYVPIGNVKPEAGEKKRFQFEKVDLGFCWCFHSSDCSKMIFISRDERIGRFWKWFLGWIGAKKKLVNLKVVKVVLECARRVFWKVRSELRKSMRPTVVHKFTYDVYSYSQNFDDGCWKNDQHLYTNNGGLVKEIGQH